MPLCISTLDSHPVHRAVEHEASCQLSDYRKHVGENDSEQRRCGGATSRAAEGEQQADDEGADEQRAMRIQRRQSLTNGGGESVRRWEGT